MFQSLGSWSKGVHSLRPPGRPGTTQPPSQQRRRWFAPRSFHGSVSLAVLGVPWPAVPQSLPLGSDCPPVRMRVSPSCGGIG